MFGREPEQETSRGRKALIFGGAGAAIMYLFDPRLGKTRRARIQDQLGGIFRRTRREVERKTEYARGHVEGLRHLGSHDSSPENDQTLTAKVESEVLSRWNFPKGDINVNAIDGVVELRGICGSPDQINDLERRVRGVTGVIDVRNYLHLPNTPAPNKEEALQRQ